MSFSKKKISWVRLITLALIFGFIFVGGFLIGKNSRTKDYSVINIANDSAPKDLNIKKTTDFSSFWYVWGAMNKLYIKADETDDTERLYGATKGLVASFKDPYSVYFSPSEAEYFQSSIQGSFGGVGMEVGVKNGLPTIIAPLEGSPAKKAGVKTGDIILAINDKSTAEMSLDAIIDLIRGEAGSTVELTLIQEGDEDSHVVSIKREVIDIPTLKTSVIGGGKIFYIQLFTFTESSVDLFKKALQEFLDSGATSLLIDLRGNPGGYLESAREIGSWFLPSGKVIVTEKNIEGEIAHRSKGYDIFNENLNLAILVDGGSASASEILAGALQDYKKAIIIGTKTFGKGSVQELVDVPGGGALKVTVSKWFTPNNHSISEKGLTPDIEVVLTPEDIKAKKDAQLNRAVDYLLHKN